MRHTSTISLLNSSLQALPNGIIPPKPMQMKVKLDCDYRSIPYISTALSPSWTKGRKHENLPMTSPLCQSPKWS
ncbi:uncharacterized protein IAS62_005524 [Cryptococcus decagattii]|uniref:Uncharacterized protein n=1 Tax=Cryptococcus decagattii TaxID=1859122 RepID=A0ABZ2B042_9TREE